MFWQALCFKNSFGLSFRNSSEYSHCYSLISFSKVFFQYLWRFLLKISTFFFENLYQNLFTISPENCSRTYTQKFPQIRPKICPRMFTKISPGIPMTFFQEFLREHVQEFLQNLFEKLFSNSFDNSPKNSPSTFPNITLKMIAEFLPFSILLKFCRGNFEKSLLKEMPRRCL